MEEKSSKCSIIGIICGSIILASGFLWFGKASLDKYFKEKNLIVVQGLSERIVKSDIALITITLENRDTDQKRFLTRHNTDKIKIMNCLKKNGIDEKSIVSENFSVYENYDKTRSFTGNDKIVIKTSDFEKVNTLRNAVNQLSSEQVFCTFGVSYIITKFLPLKMSMLEEASQNAKKSAEAAVRSYGNRITSLAHFSQGTVVITAESASATDTYDNGQSINKKVRLVVRAGFRYE